MSDQLISDAATSQHKQTQQMNFFALDGIRIRDPSSQETADLPLRPYGHRDLLL